MSLDVPQFFIGVTTRDFVRFFGAYDTVAEALKDKDVLEGGQYREAINIAIFATGKVPKKAKQEVSVITPAFLDPTLEFGDEYVKKAKSARRKRARAAKKKALRLSEAAAEGVSTKKKRTPSTYNLFMKQRVPQIKAEKKQQTGEDLDHKVAFRLAAQEWRAQALKTA